MQISSCELLYANQKHNAFTDLCQFQQALFCTFRQASDHVSHDGKVLVARLNQQNKIERKEILQMPGVDLRDPKLSVTPDGKLFLLAYARYTDKQNNTVKTKGIFWQSCDGYSWSSARFTGHSGWWLWRLSWYRDHALGFAYNRRQNAINLYSGDPRKTLDMILPGALSLKKHGAGYPNESDIVFTEDGIAYALVRRDADSYSCKLGIARPPYKQWQWHDLGLYLGGPAMVLLNNQKAIIAGRILQRRKLETALFELDLNTRKLNKRLILLSGGDCSYPGLVLQGKQLLVSYYSSHVDNVSKIYLAKISLDPSG